MSKELLKEWEDILEVETMPKINDEKKKIITAQMLDNYTRDLNEDTTTADLEKYNPVILKLIRRMTPDIVAHDILGVQPMNMPTGLVFAIKGYYAGTKDTPVSKTDSKLIWLKKDTESLTDIVDKNKIFAEDISTNSPTKKFKFYTLGTMTSDYGVALVIPDTGVDINDLITGKWYEQSSGKSFMITRVESNEALFHAILTNYAGEYSTSDAETKVANAGQLSFQIVKSQIEAKSFLLKAKYSLELYEDFKRLNGADAETELINILSNEMIAEINKRIIDKINEKAIEGGTYSFDVATSDGRWSMEKLINLYIAINKVANDIALSTRRGRGNFLIASNDVITALESAGKFKSVDEKFNKVADSPYSFAGYLSNGMKVYRDTFAYRDYVTVGYKGVTSYDAGLFYCPYIPLQLKKTVGEEDFQPRLGFRERSAIGENPYGAHNYYRMIYVNFGSIFNF